MSTKKNTSTKFKVGDIVKDLMCSDIFMCNDVYYRITAVDLDDRCYEAADCDKNGEFDGGSIEIWMDEFDDNEGYAVENYFVVVGHVTNIV